MSTDDEKIRRLIDSLDDDPIHSSWTSEDLWDSINAQKSKGTKRIKPRIYWTGIAAAVALVLLINFIDYDTQLSHTMETLDVVAEVNHSAVNIEELEALDLIRESCDSGLPICSSSEFVALSMELEVVNQELQMLDEMILRYGEDADLIRSQIEMENFKVDITFQMVQMLMS